MADLIILAKGNIEIEKMETPEIFEMTGDYSDNKHGILLKDIIHVSKKILFNEANFYIILNLILI